MSVLNFENMNRGKVGNPFSFTDVDDMANIHIPDQLPTVDENMISSVDQNTLSQLLRALKTLKCHIPKFPPRPSLEIFDKDNFNQQIETTIDDLENYINSDNRENNVKNQLSQAMDNIVQQNTALVPPPPQPPQTILLSPPFYYPPPYCFYPPPTNPPPPAI